MYLTSFRIFIEVTFYPFRGYIIFFNIFKIPTISNDIYPHFLIISLQFLGIEIETNQISLSLRITKPREKRIKKLYIFRVARSPSHRIERAFLSSRYVFERR